LRFQDGIGDPTSPFRGSNFYWIIGYDTSFKALDRLSSVPGGKIMAKEMQNKQ